MCRYEDPDNIVRKKTIPPVPAYENWIESQTKQDLQAIQFNHNSIHMESLTIRERILSTKCPDVAHPIVFRGAVCADNDRFDRCESLWLHALELRQNINVSRVFRFDTFFLRFIIFQNASLADRKWMRSILRIAHSSSEQLISINVATNC